MSLVEVWVGVRKCLPVVEQRQFVACTLDKIVFYLKQPYTDRSGSTIFVNVKYHLEELNTVQCDSVPK